jgi:hypothetical protein
LHLLFKIQHFRGNFRRKLVRNQSETSILKKRQNISSFQIGCAVFFGENFRENIGFSIISATELYFE